MTDNLDAVARRLSAFGEHVVKPWYRLTVTLSARADQTHPAGVQEFDSPEVAAIMRRLSDTANEQNLDRLQSVLASEGA